MKKRSIVLLAVVLSVILGLTTAPASQTQPAPASQQQPAPAPSSQLRLIAPALVRQGEAFTGRVVEETPTGDQPVEHGQVIFRGQVVPIQQGGKVTLPPFVKELGGTLVAAQVIRSLGGSPRILPPQHFAVVPMAGNVPTHIAQASNILNPGDIWITGEGLNAVQKAAVVKADGTQLDVSDMIGSSLQLQGHIPGNLSPGTYRFVCWDAAGNRYEAPNQSRVASLQVQGDRIIHRGQRGRISVLSDADGTVLLSGGEPQIMLDQKIIAVHAGQPAPVDFTAQQLGEYSVRAAIFDSGELPASPGARRVAATVAPIVAVFDAASGQTRATIAVHVVDEAGAPVTQAPISVVVGRPNGLDYANVVSNDQGRASLTETFAGDVAAAALSAYAYRVLGYAWTQDTTCKCENLKVMMPKDATRGGTLQGFEWSVNPDKKKDPSAPAYFELASVIWQIQCSNEEKGGCEGSFKLSVDTKGISLEKFGQKEPQREVELSYKCAGKCPGKGPTKVEQLTLFSTDKTITTIKFKLHVECDKKKGDKTFEILVANPDVTAFRPESPENKAKREAEEKAREAFAEYIQELINEANRPPGEQPHEPEKFWELGPEIEPID